MNKYREWVVDLTVKRRGIDRGWRYGDGFDRARQAGLFEAKTAVDNPVNLKKLFQWDNADCSKPYPSPTCAGAVVGRCFPPG
ncbi:hypothetical protein [Desulfosarcina sp.]|uniref:hypothetical protein n=1 Tax=Desulfosarcina sp. TaxID=2027861 RepID=UPI003563F002